MELKRVLFEGLDEDIFFIHELRNKDYVIKSTRSKQKLKLEDHLLWCKKNLILDSGVELYIITVDGVRAGYVRFDRKDATTSEISVALLEEYHGKGLAFKSVEQGVLLQKSVGIKRIQADISVDNKESIKFFVRYGFEYSHNQKGFNTYYLVLK